MSTFRVLQLNMQFGQRWDEANPDAAPIDLAATTAEIRRHHADIVFLQEVERALPGGMQIEPAPNYTRLRAALSDYHGTFSYPRADARELPFGVGLAIFSRTSLSDVELVELPSPAIEFTFGHQTTTPTDRLLIGAKTELLGHSVQLFNTHLLALFMLGAETETLSPQIELLANQISSVRGPAILAGDFNVSRHELLTKRFAAIGFSTVQQREITWRRQPFVLDHIFHNAPLRCVARTVEPTIASDHHAIVADFEFIG